MKNILKTVKDYGYEFYKHLYTCYVTPVLDSATQVWAPIKKGNIDRIESLQRYFTRRVIGPENLSYDDRVDRLNL